MGTISTDISKVLPMVSCKSYELSFISVSTILFWTVTST